MRSQHREVARRKARSQQLRDGIVKVPPIGKRGYSLANGRQRRRSLGHADPLCLERSLGMLPGKPCLVEFSAEAPVAVPKLPG
jgi:hypothetical protein